MKKSADWLRLTGLSQILTVKRLAISDRRCRRERFQRFKSGDFAVEDRHSGGEEKVVEDAELEAILSTNRVKVKKNYQNYWISVSKQFQNTRNRWE
nr:Mariner Mos1 transposase [Hymenolepis microstoma]